MCYAFIGMNTRTIGMHTWVRVGLILYFELGDIIGYSCSSRKTQEARIQVLTLAPTGRRLKRKRFVLNADTIKHSRAINISVDHAEC